MQKYVCGHCWAWSLSFYMVTASEEQREVVFTWGSISTPMLHGGFVREGRSAQCCIHRDLCSSVDDALGRSLACGFLRYHLAPMLIGYIASTALSLLRYGGKHTV